VIILPVQFISQYVCIVILLTWNINIYCCRVPEKSSARIIYWGSIYSGLFYILGCTMWAILQHI